MDIFISEYSVHKTKQTSKYRYRGRGTEINFVIDNPCSPKYNKEYINSKKNKKNRFQLFAAVHCYIE